MPVDPRSLEWQNANRFIRLFRATVGALSDADPVGLLNELAPPDEYDHEAAQIARLVLAEARGPEDVQRILADVFARAFGGVTYDASRFGDVARAVWQRSTTV